MDVCVGLRGGGGGREGLDNAKDWKGFFRCMMLLDFSTLPKWERGLVD